MTTTERRVRFGQAIVNDHYGIMGDNPACSEGFPLAIDWQRAEQHIVDLSPTQGTTSHLASLLATREKQFSLDRCDPSRPRTADELKLSSMERESRLRQMGYSRRELVRLCKPVNLVRAQRRRTAETLSLQSFQTVLQTIGQGLKRVFWSPKKRAEHMRLRKFMVRYQSNRSQSLIKDDLTIFFESDTACESEELHAL